MKTNIVHWNIERSKERLQKELLADKLIIFIARVLEDLENNKGTDHIKHRLFEISHLITPYSQTLIDLNKYALSLPNICQEGITISQKDIFVLKEIIYFTQSCSNITERKRLINALDKHLNLLISEYLPESLKILDYRTLAKIICAIEGIKKASQKPSSTIQLIGAEKALFRHKSIGCPSPKHGLIYNALNNEKNKGKGARILANKLSIALKVDYYRRFAQ